jgi:hypothetical protein
VGSVPLDRPTIGLQAQSRPRPVYVLMFAFGQDNFIIRGSVSVLISNLNGLNNSKFNIVVYFDLHYEYYIFVFYTIFNFFELICYLLLSISP